MIMCRLLSEEKVYPSPGPPKTFLFYTLNAETNVSRVTHEKSSELSIYAT